MLKNWKHQAPVYGGLVLAGVAMISLLSLVISFAVSAGSDFASGEVITKRIDLELPIRSKVIPVNVENQLEFLRQADENKTRLGEGQRLTVGRAFASVKAGEELPAGSEVLLHYPEANRLLLDVGSQPLSATLTEDVRGEAFESLSLPLKVIYAQDALTGRSVQAVLLMAYLAEADQRRIEAALEFERPFGDEEIIEDLEAELESAQVSGFLVVQDGQRAFAVYPVVGSFRQSQFQLEPSAHSSDFHAAGLKLLDAIEDFALKRKEPEELRPQYITSATSLLGSALALSDSLFHKEQEASFNLSISIPETSEKQPLSIEASLLKAQAVPLPDWIDSVEILSWANEGRLAEDRQQMRALAIQPMIGQKVFGGLAAILLSYEPDFPADSHTCAPMVTRFAVHGERSGEQSALFSRLYSGPQNEWPVWTLEQASFTREPSRKSSLLSWRFLPAQPERFESQSIASGAKAFINWMTDFRAREWAWKNSKRKD